MSLLSEAFEPFVFVDKIRQADGEGGYITTWKEGAEFMAVANTPNSTISEIANALTERINYTITTSKAVTLEAMDVIKRVSDGRYFRITSDGSDNRTPESATLDMRQSTAEVWQLPTSS
jgi:hypothetical protein